MADPNDGVVLLNPAPCQAERTLIVSGLARSGTSMIAAMLDRAGIFLGTELDTIVREDLEIADVLGTAGLGRIVDARNRTHLVWGFKRPNLHGYGPDIVGAFRNPLVILTMRDCIAIARRDVLSEHRLDECAAAQVAAAAQETLALVAFAMRLTCPVLLISYEKAVQDPRRLAQAVTSFAGLAADIDAVAEAVEPNRKAYLDNAERRFDGHIDGVLDNAVHGWASEVGSATPVVLDLMIDGFRCATLTADGFRADLAAAGVGAGCHGFNVRLPADIAPQARITVRVAGRTHELKGSGTECRVWTA